MKSFAVYETYDTEEKDYLLFMLNYNSTNKKNLDARSYYMD